MRRDGLIHILEHLPGADVNAVNVGVPYDGLAEIESGIDAGQVADNANMAAQADRSYAVLECSSPLTSTTASTPVLPVTRRTSSFQSGFFL